MATLKDLTVLGSSRFISDVTANNLTVEGTTTLSGDPTNPNEAATKHYVDGSATSAMSRIYIGSCASDASDNPKIVTVTDLPEANSTTHEPPLGTVISVLFTGASNTVNAPSLKVNNMAAARIWTNSQINSTTSIEMYKGGYNNRYIQYMWNGTDWVFIGWSYFGYNYSAYTLYYSQSYSMPVSDAVYNYRLFFTSKDGTKWVPANTSSSTSATTQKAVNTKPIDPFGWIVYYNSATDIASGDVPGASTLYFLTGTALGHSFNTTGAALTLTRSAPVYVKCNVATTASQGVEVGDITIHPTEPIVQALPQTADGCIYIFLGWAYSATSILLTPYHPVYYHNGTGIRQWTQLVDSTPTANSNNLVKSGGVKSYVDTSISTALTNSQADWVQTNSNHPSYINNKPSITEDKGVNSTKENDIENNVAIGSYSHAEGRNTSAYSNYSHAEGYLTGTGSGVQGAHSEGVGKATHDIKTARTYGSFSCVGSSSIADIYIYSYDNAPNIGDCIGAVSDGIFYYAVVISIDTSNNTMELVQSADWSQIIMPLAQSSTLDFYICNGVALGYGSHTEGIYNTALGAGSHAEGIGTVTLNSGEHAEGEYNLSTSGAGTPETPNSGDTVHSVGIGSATNGVTTRKNAFEILRNGNMYVYGIGGYNGRNASSNRTLSLKDAVLLKTGGTMSGAIDMGNNKITSVANGINAGDVATIDQVLIYDDSIEAYNAAGSTISNLIAPTHGTDAATKGYVDKAISDIKLSLLQDTSITTIDGTKDVNIAYFWYTERTTLPTLGFASGAVMTSGRICHIFVYRATGASAPEVGSYGLAGQFKIPNNIFVGSAATTPTTDNYVWINGVLKNGGSVNGAGQYTIFQTPDRGMLEISVMYTTYESQYRTIIKVDSEEIAS